MLHKLLIQILAFIFAILLSIFAIGTILTASAPTAVGVLTTDFPVESVQIPDIDGPTVHGWLVYGKSGNGVVLLVHSMRSNRLEMLSRARFLKDQGFTVLFIDLQAHGETTGDNITFGLRESKNVEVAVTFLRKAFPAERIGAIGTSLGAAAIVLAKQDLGLNAVILESLHPTIEEAVENRLKLHFGEFGVLLLPLMLWQLSFYLDTSMDALSPIAQINNLNSPVLFISGTNDMHTTQSETERLFEAARIPKDLWIVTGARHFNMHTYAGREYELRVIAFLSKYLHRHNEQ
ncbi:alpha/beta hydrolase [uncultured Nitrosomonas sp.]|uniref:alpha/beta hydrolase n=1 Tax=uncultured Nitrosomonas sp. TaxID=156424 RepID=UPI0025CE6CDA|nr:alpha/beta hydrolase [uncultured Nitrosomonas sp.]